ncbi:uncharacterized protein CG3556 [Parasteatoda tepidariorum]|uniref:uncharacterized protein CG3556 n=1 Tax=Parasteatoda tepidariorum TaxID=114398 RepID=UPI001C723620|nr:uncharacterized protein CG3556 [Parasteatoda tepidariorum]
MWNLISSLLFATLCFYQALPIQSKCVDLKDLSGNITEIYSGPKNIKYNKCWNILNPENNSLEIELKHLDFEKRSCDYVCLTILVNKTGEKVKWCENSQRKKIAVYSKVSINFYADYGELTPNSRKNFEIHYKIDTSTKGIEGVKDALKQTVNWSISNSTSWKWIDHIPKVITALALSEGAKFDGKNREELLMVKQRELRISIALLRDTISSEQLSIFINSILSTCHNPRNFYGYNLVELLKEQIASENFTHPVSYLALCNANETWPVEAYENLLKIYKSKSRLPINRDYQAFAVMALSCELRLGGSDSIPNGIELSRAYKETVLRLMSLQSERGSFGNVQRTAVMTQALLSSVAINGFDDGWDHMKAFRFLLKSMKVPPTDVLSTYLILPLLNDKTLVDIAFTNCSASRDQDDLVAEVHDYLGPKIQVQYSLFIGGNKDVIHTIILKVPKYFTAFDVMKFAALKDKKYKFKYETVSGELDIYELADIQNNPEDGKFWLFYKKKAAAGNAFEQEEEGPEKITLSEGDHIAMWYKRYSMN